MSAKVLISHFRTWSCLLPAFLFPPFHFTFLKCFKRKYLLPHFYLDSITFPENICMATLSNPVLFFWGFYLWGFFLKHSHFSPKCYFIDLAFYHCFCHHSLSVYLNPRNLYQTCFYVHSLKWGGKKLWKKKNHTTLYGSCCHCIIHCWWADPKFGLWWFHIMPNTMLFSSSEKHISLTW